MLKRIHKELNKLEPTFYHEQYRPYNFREACLIVIVLGLLFGSVLFGLALLI